MLKSKKLDDSDDDNCGLLKQALHVEMPDDFNPNKIPQTGEEYLQHVVYERTKCRTWITADIDREKFKNQQTFKLEIEATIKKPPSVVIPTVEWQTIKVEDFTNFRKFVHFKIEKEPTINSFVEDTFFERITSEYPKFSEVTKYTQAAKMRMLNILSKQIDSIQQGHSIDEKMGAWIYAILALLEKPLSPDSCYSLREFTKRCLVLRSNLEENCDPELYKPLNLFICIVARFYNQLDLADS